MGLEGPQAKDGHPCPQRPSSPATSHHLRLPAAYRVQPRALGEASDIRSSPSAPSSMKPSLTTPNTQTRNVLIFPGAHNTSPIPFL